MADASLSPADHPSVLSFGNQWPRAVYGRWRWFKAACELQHFLHPGSADVQHQPCGKKSPGFLTGLDGVSGAGSVTVGRKPRYKCRPSW